jgi:hypothetical protein
MSRLLHLAELVPGLPSDIVGLTTTRSMGSFGFGSDEPVASVFDRWNALQEDLRDLGIDRLACGHQVHGAGVMTHAAGWHGWLRGHAVDGHVTATRGTALAVTVADCTPVLVWHPGGGIAALHAGWRGTAAHILDAGLAALAGQGFPADECRVWLGPAICGSCYEVGPEVLSAIHGVTSGSKGYLDVRTVLAEQAMTRRVAQVTTSPGCSRCHRDRYFSHRGGDVGRMLGIVALLQHG